MLDDDRESMAACGENCVDRAVLYVVCFFSLDELRLRERLFVSWWW